MTTFNIYRRESLTQEPVQIATGLTSKNFSITGLTKGKKYLFSVGAVKNSIEKVSDDVVVRTAPKNQHFDQAVSLLLMNDKPVTDLKGNQINGGSKPVIDTVKTLNEQSTLSFSNTSHYFDIVSNNFNFGTADFCIKCWVWINSVPGGGVNNDMTIIEISNGFFIYASNNLGGFTFWDGSISYGLGNNSSSILGTVGWKYVEVNRNGTTLRLLVDGVLVASGTYSRNINRSSFARVGGSITNSATRWMRGNICKLEVYKGWGGATSSYTPPDTPEFDHWIP